MAEAERPLVVRKRPRKLRYSANGILKSEHVKADALVRLLGFAEC